MYREYCQRLKDKRTADKNEFLETVLEINDDIDRENIQQWAEQKSDQWIKDSMIVAMKIIELESYALLI
jgi:hypothetical protein